MVSSLSLDKSVACFSYLEEMLGNLTWGQERWERWVSELFGSIDLCLAVFLVFLLLLALLTLQLADLSASRGERGQQYKILKSENVQGEVCGRL